MANDNPYQPPGASNGPDERRLHPVDMARITRQTVMAVLLLAVAGGILTCLLNEVDEPRSIASSLSSLLFVILVGRWMYFDNQQYDLRGMRYWYLGVLCCALFAVPAYFFTTRGWKGWLPIWASLGTLVAYGMVNVVTVLLVESLLPS